MHAMSATHDPAAGKGRAAMVRLALSAACRHARPMELKHLKHFVAVADDGGISAAARRLGLTQPALSRQVKALEQDSASRCWIAEPARSS